MLQLQYILVLSSLTVIVFCQRPYIANRDLNPEVQLQCQSDWGITPERIAELEAQSINCQDRFGEDEAARCYHTCILRKIGLFTDDNKINEAVLLWKWGFLNHIRVRVVAEKCIASYTGTEKCGFEYYVHKCIDKSLGDYPHGTRVPGKDNVDPAIEVACMELEGVTEEEVCVAVSNTVTDGFEESVTLQCYSACIIDKLGFYVDSVLQKERVRQRFFYVSDSLFEATYEGCKGPEGEHVCTMRYHYYKCLKQAFGEYPINV